MLTAVTALMIGSLVPASDQAYAEVTIIIGSMLANRITVTRQQHFFREQFEHVCGKKTVFTIFQIEGLKVIGNLFIPQDFKEGDVSLPAVLVAGGMTGLRNNLTQIVPRLRFVVYLGYSIHRPEIILSYNLSKTDKRSNSPSSTLDR